MYIEIKTQTELLAKKEAIHLLFKASFGQKLEEADWYWFYINNPAGAAYVSLFYDDDSGQLLGHYAVIPTKFTYMGESFIAYRSMTTMVHPEGRGRGLFTEMAKRVYDLLAQDKAALVYGFPNANSAPGFAKHLGWNLMKHDSVVDFRGSEILNDTALVQVLTKAGDNAIAWDTNDIAQSKWRIEKPNAKMQALPGLVTKDYDGLLNVLHISSVGLSHINPEAMYRVLVPANFKPDQIAQRGGFEYQFGFRIFDSRFTNANFRNELIMSDVF